MSLVLAANSSLIYSKRFSAVWCAIASCCAPELRRIRLICYSRRNCSVAPKYAPDITALPRARHYLSLLIFIRVRARCGSHKHVRTRNIRSASASLAPDSSEPRVKRCQFEIPLGGDHSAAGALHGLTRQTPSSTAEFIFIRITDKKASFDGGYCLLGAISKQLVGANCRSGPVLNVSEPSKQHTLTMHLAENRQWRSGHKERAEEFFSIARRIEWTSTALGGLGPQPCWQRH